ncbi:hypothetical protein GLOIN_2v1709640 [Rhizophagus irregularis DAOM 181602=DAOM 197198]|nr:hypothetical protein GLOIN_2v1709640 [Rhizophagus irregularis DAOM 181602=DAOM 197198]
MRQPFSFGSLETSDFYPPTLIMEQNNPYKQEVEFVQVLQRPIEPGDEIFSQSLSALGVPHQGLLVTTVGTTSGDYDDGTNQYFIDQVEDIFESAGGNTPYNLFTANCIQSCSRAVGTSGEPLIPNAREYNENPYFDERPPIRSASYMGDYVITSQIGQYQHYTLYIYHINKTIFREINGMTKCNANIKQNDLFLLKALQPYTKSIPDVNPCSLYGKGIYSASNPPYKEFTLASCGHIFHQKCLEKYLEKGSQDKATTPTTDTTSKQVDSGDQTPVDEDADVILMNELGILGGEEQSSSKTTDQASSSIEATKETSDQATSPIEVVSTTPGNSKNVDDSISKELSSGQIQRPICEKCSEEISIDFQKDTVFLSCKHAVHLDCINDLHKRCPTCTSADDMESFPVEQASSTAQKRSSDLPEKSSSKKQKTSNKEGVPSMLKKLIEELLTDNSNNEDLEESNASLNSGNFFHLSSMIDQAEEKNKDATRNVINRYFDFGEALHLRYKELKPSHGKYGAEALVKDEVRKQISVTELSDEALRKRMERAEKLYKLFNAADHLVILRNNSVCHGTGSSLFIRQKELQLFNVNSIPYLINTDCARNILVAVLKEYNNKTPDQYFKRIVGNIVANQEFDNSKILVAWCFGHAIRAI